MRLGIDFGTTHTVAALVDRGNYPVVGFDWGDAVPSLLAVRARDGALLFGRDAQAVETDPDWELVRSFKRLLRDAGPLTELRLHGRSFKVADLLAGYLAALRRQIVQHSNLEPKAGEPLEVAVSVPAHASNDQRFLTLDAFRRAGFEVLTLLNEPSAAGFEYGHRFRRTLTSRREHVLVYDLGGGTFDASLIRMSGRSNEVVSSAGLPELGGDDFDAAILDLVVSAVRTGSLEPRQLATLREACRQQKEGLTSQSRRLVVDLTLLGRAPLVLPVSDVQEACAGLVARTLEVVDQVLAAPPGGAPLVDPAELAGFYVVGGGSSFPPVLRELRERFGQRVKRSPHPFAATAIGLACFLDEEAGYELADCLTRHFGVWREAAAGTEVAFDPIFPRDTRLPGPKDPPLSVVRRYRPVHNVGHYRYVECGALREGRPENGVTPWDGILFPFDPVLREIGDLSAVPVRRLEANLPEVEERYECGPAGTFQVTLTSLADGYSRSYQIGRMAGRIASVEAAEMPAKRPASPRSRGRG